MLQNGAFEIVSFALSWGGYKSIVRVGGGFLVVMALVPIKSMKGYKNGLFLPRAHRSGIAFFMECISKKKQNPFSCPTSPSYDCQPWQGDAVKSYSRLPTRNNIACRVGFY